jgi:hypothetical protein
MEEKKKTSSSSSSVSSSAVRSFPNLSAPPPTELEENKKKLIDNLDKIIKEIKIISKSEELEELKIKYKLTGLFSEMDDIVESENKRSRQE